MNSLSLLLPAVSLIYAYAQVSESPTMAPTSLVQVSDPEAWTLDTQGFHLYKSIIGTVEPTSNNIDDARSYCQNLTIHGDLASIREDADLYVLGNLTHTPSHASSFIGLVYTNGWAYLNSERDPLEMPDFRTGEPNGGGSEPCARWQFWSGGPGINDVFCQPHKNYNTTNFICEIRCKYSPYHS